MTSDREMRLPGTDGVICFKGPQRTFLAEVAFVADSNVDGTDRQSILKRCKEGEPIRLVRATEDPNEPQSVAVFRENGEQLGYVEFSRAPWWHLYRGGEITAKIFALGSPEYLRSLNSRHQRNEDIRAQGRVEVGCLLEIGEGSFGKDYLPFWEKNREIENLIRDAQGKEQIDPNQAIQIYRKAIEEIVKLDSISTLAKAWRCARYPINRLSLLLEKAGREEEALQMIEAYEGFNDMPVGIHAGDKDAIKKRKTRLLLKLGGAHEIPAEDVATKPRRKAVSAKKPPPPKITHFYTEVRGITKRNRDGTSRQRIIREELVELLPLKLEREEGNKEDPNATKVLTRDGQQVGYLMKSAANALIRSSKTGCRHAAFVDEILEWEAFEGHTHHGISALIFEISADTSEDELREYVHSSFVHLRASAQSYLLKGLGLQDSAVSTVQPETRNGAQIPIQPAKPQIQCSPPKQARSGCLGVLIFIVAGACVVVLM